MLKETNVGCVVISDRGDLYLPGCLDALQHSLPPEIPIRIVDDKEHRLGLAGAARAAWQIAVDEGWDYVWYNEEDFVPATPGLYPIPHMIEILEAAPHLAQVVLKRQPWSVDEMVAGGIIESAPGHYHDAEIAGYPIVTHRRIFSLNPCVIPRWVLEIGWPDSNEAGMTEILCQNPDTRFAFYGKRDAPPLVTHCGATRGNGWKL